MSIIEHAPEQLTVDQWRTAHSIAHELASSGADVNELGKAIAYLRSAIDRNASSAGTQFFKFLKTLVSNGYQIGHSSKTVKYYRKIQEACDAHLKVEEADARRMLCILGWTARLMRYYKAMPGEAIPDIKDDEVLSVTKRQAALEGLKAIQSFEEGQIIDAEVERKHPKGSKVTYLIASISFTEKEPKAFNSIPDSGAVKVQIKSLKEDGSINHVKFFKT